MVTIDACGLSCPEPVLRLRQVIADHREIHLLVDNQTSVEICTRFAKSKGFSVEVAGGEGGYTLALRKE